MTVGHFVNSSDAASLTRRMIGSNPLGKTKSLGKSVDEDGRPARRACSRLQMLDLDEGEVVGVGVDHVVLDARAPRVGNVALSASRCASFRPAPLAEGRRRPGARRHSRPHAGAILFGAGLKSPFGDPHMRLRDMDLRRGFRS